VLGKPQRGAGEVPSAGDAAAEGSVLGKRQRGVGEVPSAGDAAAEGSVLGTRQRGVGEVPSAGDSAAEGSVPGKRRCGDEAPEQPQQMTASDAGAAVLPAVPPAVLPAVLPAVPPAVPPAKLAVRPAFDAGASAGGAATAVRASVPEASWEAPPPAARVGGSSGGEDAHRRFLAACEESDMLNEMPFVVWKVVEDAHSIKRVVMECPGACDSEIIADCDRMIDCAQQWRSAVGPADGE
jgi:hypothetical protein